jgi:hypothetical protein
VTMPYAGLAGGTIVGLQQFVDQRAAFLNSNAELVAAGPAINWIEASASRPDPGQTVEITASVSPPAGGTVSAVDLYYRPTPASRYQRAAMPPIGGGQYRVQMPVAGTPGQRVGYYVRAAAGNSFASQSFLPQKTEWEPAHVQYAFGATGGMRITEWMYAGTSGEFVEFTNRSQAPIGMTGWSFDDDHADAGAFDLSALGVVLPGESVILTDRPAEAFRTAWGLGPTVKIVGDLGLVTGNNLGRNDQIHLFDSAGVLVDRLSYGDQMFPGTIQTQGVSGQTCSDSIGRDDASLWEASALGDRYNSFSAASGEVGTPGAYNSPACAGACYANCDGSTAAPVLNVADFTCFLQRYAAGDSYANCDQSTAIPVLNVADFTCFLQRYAAGCP